MNIKVSVQVEDREGNPVGSISGEVFYTYDGILEKVRCNSSSLGQDEYGKEKAKNTLKKLGDAALIGLAEMYPRYEKAKPFKLSKLIPMPPWGIPD